MLEPGWITFNDAAVNLSRVRRASVGATQAQIRAACADGLIQSMRAPAWWDGDELCPEPIEHWDRISPDEWRARAVDHDSDGAVMDDVTVIMLNEDDLRHWAVQPPKITSVLLVRKTIGKQPRVVERLKDKFKGEPVPEPGLCPRKALKAELLLADPSLTPLDEDTLKRAIDAYNSTLPRRVYID
ncbi:MAG: hypothetical protein WA733_04700 [Methylocystis sp.]|jgi:hypothetical protein